ncbi:MAG: multiheme c-type cytochrome [Planctomycetota bacterium]|jgi:mono/diheme cytochrome c family protein
MYKRMQIIVGGALAALLALVLISVWTDVGSAQPGAAEPAGEPAPPGGQTYTGSKRCASCHFKQFMAWKKDKHSKVFELLPKKYQADPKCLKCHTTGYGEPTGFQDAKSSSSLAGVTCESCHGPGSKHEEVCKPLATVKKLNPAQQKQANDSIWRMLPKNVCVECHATKGHKESETPKELRKSN